MSEMERFNRFVDILTEKEPSLEIRYKNESKLMKLIDFVLFFNKRFMAGYTTTIGSKVYYPSRDHVRAVPLDRMITLAHEYRHIRDSQKWNPALYSILYIMPQLLVLLGIPMAFFIGWWALLFLLFLAPLPAWYRKYIELRGYQMTLFAINEALIENGWSELRRRNHLARSADHINRSNFKGSAYYFMWPFGVQKALDETVEKVISGDILSSNSIYPEVQDAMKNSKV